MGKVIELGSTLVLSCAGNQFYQASLSLWEYKFKFTSCFEQIAKFTDHLQFVYVFFTKAKPHRVKDFSAT